MIKGKFLSPKDDLHIITTLRNLAFEDTSYLSSINDSLAMHVIAYDDNKPIGCGSIQITDDDTMCIINNICVLPEYRKRRYGDFILRMLVDRAFSAHIYNIRLTTPYKYITFFKNIGFANTLNCDDITDDINTLTLNEDSPINMLLTSSTFKTGCGHGYEH